jgi:hypothetical protein
VALCLLTSGCFLNKKKKGGDDGESSLVDKKSIFLDRTGDGDTARLKFNTTKAVFCSLEIYSQEKDVEPTSKNPTKIECKDESEGKKEFVEKIDGLRTDMLYFVNVLLYTKKEQTKPTEKVTIKESGGGSGTVTEDGKYSELLVARLNQPLKTAEFHRHGFTEPVAAEVVRNKITRKTGCSMKIPADASPFATAETTMGINNFTTTDYGAGKVTKHEDATGRLKVAYDNLKTGIDRWSFLYDRDSKDVQIKALPGSYFHTVEVGSAALSDPELAELGDSETTSVDAGKPLVVTWTHERKTSSSTPAYVIALVGVSGTDDSIRCIFDVNKKRGEIPSSLLKNLGNSEYDILVELETNQLWAKEGWLIAAYDWRYGRIDVAQ